MKKSENSQDSFRMPKMFSDVQKLSYVLNENSFFDRMLEERHQKTP